MSEPKITFADENPVSGGSVHGLVLSVSPGVADILAAIHFGHAQAIDMYRTLTTPPPQPSQAPSQAIFGEPVEEDMEPGFIDTQGLWAMSPEARQAILSRAGLQVMAPIVPEEDPVEKDMEHLKKQTREEI